MRERDTKIHVEMRCFLINGGQREREEKRLKSSLNRRRRRK